MMHRCRHFVSLNPVLHSFPKGLVSTFVNLCGNGQGEITYDSFVKLLWQVMCNRRPAASRGQ